MTKDFLNSNNLVNGKFPPRVVCKFACKRKDCPGKMKNRETSYSCALARGLSLNKKLK